MHRTRTLFGILTLAVFVTLSGISLAHDDEHHEKGGESKEHHMKEGSDSSKQGKMEGHEYRDDRGHKIEGSGGEHAGKEYKDDHHGEYKEGHSDRKAEGSGGMK